LFILLLSFRIRRVTLTSVLVVVSPPHFSPWKAILIGFGRPLWFLTPPLVSTLRPSSCGIYHLLMVASVSVGPSFSSSALSLGVPPTHFSFSSSPSFHGFFTNLTFPVRGPGSCLDLPFGPSFLLPCCFSHNFLVFSISSVFPPRPSFSVISYPPNPLHPWK